MQNSSCTLQSINLLKCISNKRSTTFIKLNYIIDQSAIIPFVCLLTWCRAEIWYLLALWFCSNFHNRLVAPGSTSAVNHLKLNNPKTHTSCRLNANRIKNLWTQFIIVPAPRVYFWKLTLILQKHSIVSQTSCLNTSGYTAHTITWPIEQHKTGANEVG